MFKLTLLLGAAIFLVLLIGGEDRGQLRPGLAAAALAPAQPVADVAAAPAAAQPDDAADIAPATAPVVVAAAAPSPAAPAAGPESAPVATGEEPAVFSLATFADPARAAAPAEAAPSVAQAEDGGGAGPVVIVDAESVNVRSGPGTEFVVLTRLSRGEAVTQIGDAGNGWALVRMEGDGVEGYVAMRFLTRP